MQNCLDGYFNNCLFHRIISGFMMQTGDPVGRQTGATCESVWSEGVYNQGVPEPFPLELHSRLSFRYRGLVGV